MKRGVGFMLCIAGALFCMSGRLYAQVDLEQYKPSGAVIPPATDVGGVMRTLPYLQDPAPDAVTVMWLTNVPCRSWVEYGTDTADMKRARTLDEGMMTVGEISRIRLDGLQPGTEYYYRACSQEVLYYSSYYKALGDTVRSPLYSFRTWDDADTDFTMLVFNDLHRRTEMYERLLSHVADTGYDVILFNGDCFNDMETEEQVVEPLKVYTAASGGHGIPSVFVRGNHETRGAYSLRLWDYVAKKGGRSYSAFNIGDTRIVILDCGEDKPDDSPVYYGMNDFAQYRAGQADFLREEVASDGFRNASRRVLVHHMPIYGRRAGKTNLCRPYWHPVLEDAPFDICINAHQHEYRYVAKGEDGNNFPVVIGGGYKPEDATVMVLDKKGGVLHLKVVDAFGKMLFDSDL